MSGFELCAKFYPRVPTLAQLIEEAQEGVDYPFAVHQILQLQPKDYSKLCRDLDKEYGFERMLPEEGYDPVYGSFNCVLVMPVNGKEGLLMTRYADQIFAAHLPDCTLLDLEDAPQQRTSLYPSKHPWHEVVR